MAIIPKDPPPDKSEATEPARAVWCSPETRLLYLLERKRHLEQHTDGPFDSKISLELDGVQVEIENLQEILTIIYGAKVE